MILQIEHSVSRTQFSNPFYVIVHAEDVYFTTDMDRRKFDSVLNEIDFIRKFEEYVELGRKIPSNLIPPGIPRDRPILVSGFLGDICVREQRDVLRRAGYDAYTCSEMTYF